MPLQLTEIAKARRRIADHNKLLKTSGKAVAKVTLPQNAMPVFSSVRSSRSA
jgi:hypothetical protein